MCIRDSFILEESVFMRHIVNLATFVQRQPSRIVLVGAPASTPETEYGWIEPGETFGRIESDRVLQVKRFWEKPSKAQARSCQMCIRDSVRVSNPLLKSFPLSDLSIEPLSIVSKCAWISSCSQVLNWLTYSPCPRTSATTIRVSISWVQTER